LTIGSVEPLKAFYRDYQQDVRFVEVLVRQAHPGPNAPPYRRPGDKYEDATRYVRDERIPWTLAIDDLDGSVHAAYGMLPDPTYIIGTDGRVAFYGYWTHVPTIRRALERVMAGAGRSVVGEQRLPHPAAALVAGWPGIARGLPQSAEDLDRAALPGSAALLRAGYAARRMLHDAFLTSRPWPRPFLYGVLSGVAVVLGVAARRRASSAGRVWPDPSTMHAAS
jgi:hypothetical protein